MTSWQPAARGRVGHLAGLWLWAAALTLALAVVATPRLAHADSSVIVLNVISIDGDDELAHSLSDALRVGAQQVPGWAVSDREVSLSQMSLIHGCEEPNTRCMADIAGTLKVDRLLYGEMEHTDDGVLVSLHNFDAVTGHIEGSYEEVVPAAALQGSSMKQTATKLAKHVAGLQAVGSLRVLSNAPGAAVSLDGRSVGTLDDQGELTLKDIPAGSRTLVVEGESGRQEREVEISEGQTAELSIELAAVGGVPMGDGEAVPAMDEGPPTDKKSGPGWQKIAGWSAVGLSGAFVVSTAVVWARIGSLNDDADLNAYRSMFPGPEDPAGFSDVCVPAREGLLPGSGGDPDLPMRVADVCDKADSLEVMQWVFLGLAVASGGAGAALLLTDRQEDSGMAVTPHFGRGRGGVTLRMRF